MNATRAVSAVTVVLAFRLRSGCTTGSSREQLPEPTPTVSIAPGLIPAKVLTERSVSVGGEARSYGFYLPATASSHPPLLVLTHLLVPAPGAASPGSGDATTLIDVARDYGIAVATPTGLDFSFNGGTCCGTASRRNVDDLSFLPAVSVFAYGTPRFRVVAEPSLAVLAALGICELLRRCQAHANRPVRDWSGSR